MTPDKSSVLLQDEPWWLHNALYLLNHKDPIQRGAMRRLVAAWDDAGRDAQKTLRALPELRSCLYDESGLPSWGATFATNGSGLRVRLVPDDTRLPRPLTQNDMKMRIACVRFVQFLLTKDRERLAGPCKWKHCEKYFLLKGKRRTACCSRPCSQLDSADNYTRERRKDAREEKLRVAEELAGKWITARTKDDWKQWVSKQPEGAKTEITPKFLTRAVNHYGLVEPTKGR
jgi:hypothetical protein